MEKLPKKPTPEELDSITEQKIQELYENYSDLELSPELEEEWYFVEMQARAGKEEFRKNALSLLDDLIEKLKELKKKQN